MPRSDASVGVGKKGVGRAVTRLWRSPTITTWGVSALRIARFLSVTALILNKFSTAEVALWFLFASLVTMGQLADAGFSPTFSRMSAFVMGGASDLRAD